MCRLLLAAAVLPLVATRAGAADAKPASGSVEADVAVILDPASDGTARMKVIERIKEREPSEGRAAVDALVAALPAAQGRAWHEAVSALSLIGPPAEPAVPALLEAMEAPQRETDYRRGAAALALGGIRARPAEAVPALARMVKKPSPKWADRTAAMLALSRFGPDAAPAVGVLVDVLRSSDKWDRSGAAAALGQIGPAAAPAVPDLLAVLKSPDAVDRAGAARALGQVGASPAEVVPALVAALDDPSEEVRAGALWGLGAIGPAAAPAALPRVRTIDLTRKNQPVQGYALVRLGDTDAGLARLRPFILSEAPDLDAFSAAAPAGKPVVPLLVQVISSDARGALWAIRSLGEIGPDAAGGVPALLAVVKAGRQRGPKAARFDAAVRALGAIGPGARDAVPALDEIAAMDPSADVRRMAGAAVRRIKTGGA